MSLVLVAIFSLGLRPIQNAERVGLEESDEIEILSNIIWDIAQKRLVSWINTGKTGNYWLMVGTAPTVSIQDKMDLDEEIFQSLVWWHEKTGKNLMLLTVAEDSISGYLHGHRLVDKRKEQVPDVRQIRRWFEDEIEDEELRSGMEEAVIGKGA